MKGYISPVEARERGHRNHMYPDDCERCGEATLHEWANGLAWCRACGHHEDLQWDPEEQAVVDHIAAAMNGIQAWGLRANAAELAEAVHGMQLFVAIHAMARIGFKDISIWYTSQMDNEEVKKSMETPETPAAEPERDNMEDERPAEPGTVGDNLEDVAPDAEPEQGSDGEE